MPILASFSLLEKLIRYILHSMSSFLGGVEEFWSEVS